MRGPAEYRESLDRQLGFSLKYLNLEHVNAFFVDEVRVEILWNRMLKGISQCLLQIAALSLGKLVNSKWAMLEGFVPSHVSGAS